MNKDLLLSVPHGPGVYLMRNSAGSILYIGKAIDLRKRVANYFSADVEPKTRALMADVEHIDTIAAAGEREALVMEQRLIHRHQPLYNVMWKDGKSYPWVKLSKEDFPRLSLTREKKRDGAEYFGPYPNTTSVRSLLRSLWMRGMTRLRPCDYEFSTTKPLDRKVINACLYFHTRQCPAPCAGRISKEDYGRLAEEARLYFRGKNADLRKAWEKDMKAAAAALDFERAAKTRDALAALDHVNDRVTFRVLREEDVQGRILESRAVQELQRELGLARPPSRIEAFDISHIQGFETVASMVSFQGGKPAKSGYRKFKIRTVAGVDDFAAMGEVVFRRYRRVRDEKLPLPDLILVDGGPGQLAAAMKALERVGGRRPPAAALAKREEEVYLPGRGEPLRLAKDSPALQLLQRVRDESHRFAVGFHRARRAKRLLSGVKIFGTQDQNMLTSLP